MGSRRLWTDLGEESSPDGFDVWYTSSLDQRVELVGLRLSALFGRLEGSGAYCDINTVIGQDESGVRGGELSGRHFDCICVTATTCGVNSSA